MDGRILRQRTAYGDSQPPIRSHVRRRSERTRGDQRGEWRSSRGCWNWHPWTDLLVGTVSHVLTPLLVSQVAADELTSRRHPGRRVEGPDVDGRIFLDASG